MARAPLLLLATPGGAPLPNVLAEYATSTAAGDSQAEPCMLIVGPEGDLTVRTRTAKHASSTRVPLAATQVSLRVHARACADHGGRAPLRASLALRRAHTRDRTRARALCRMRRRKPSWQQERRRSASASYGCGQRLPPSPCYLLARWRHEPARARAEGASMYMYRSV